MATGQDDQGSDPGRSPRPSEPPPPPPPPRPNHDDLPAPDPSLSELPPPAHDDGPPVNDDAWQRAITAALVLTIVRASLLIAFLGPPTAYGLGALVGESAIEFGLGAVVSALLARNSRRRWGWGRHLLVVFAVALVLAFVLAAGRIQP